MLGRYGLDWFLRMWYGEGDQNGVRMSEWLVLVNLMHSQDRFCICVVMGWVKRRLKSVRNCPHIFCHLGQRGGSLKIHISYQAALYSLIEQVCVQVEKGWYLSKKLVWWRKFLFFVFYFQGIFALHPEFNYYNHHYSISIFSPQRTFILC